MTDNEAKVVNAARRWAITARQYKLEPGSGADELMIAVNKLERGEVVLHFCGEPVEIGKPVTESLYEYLKSQVPKGPSWWSIR